MQVNKSIVLVGMMGSGKSTIGYLLSKKFNFSFLETKDPIEDFPDPIIPKNTMFSFDFISFFIEKTQICLNLKLLKVICKL